MRQLELGDISIDVDYKDIKNIHLSVYPPAGQVRIAAPLRMDIETVRIFAISKLNWIRKQQEKIRAQAREAPREFLNRESHYYKGKRYLLKVVEQEAPPEIKVEYSTLVLSVRPDTSIEKRQSIINEWYRGQLKKDLPILIEKWERKLNVEVNEYRIRKMKTKWGTCNRRAKIICLNLDLAKKPTECLEYILVHEMIHLIEQTHNERFISYMNHYMPKWRFYRDELNSLPLKHEHW